MLSVIIPSVVAPFEGLPIPHIFLLNHIFFSLFQVRDRQEQPFQFISCLVRVFWLICGKSNIRSDVRKPLLVRVLLFRVII